MLFRSQHLKGTAADIRVPNMTANEVYDYADKVFHNGGVGRYKNHTHVDTRGRKARW